MPRLHRFLPHVASLELDRRTQQAARIYCATGIVQPCLLYLFGAARGTHAMQRFREWQVGGEDGGGGGGAELPTEHIEYCAACCEHTSIREQVEAAVGVKNLSVSAVSGVSGVSGVSEVSGVRGVSGVSEVRGVSGLSDMKQASRDSRRAGPAMTLHYAQHAPGRLPRASTCRMGW